MNEDAMQEKLIKQYLNGDSSALALLLEQIQGRVFNLSVRMLFSIEDAEDAAQEILIRVIGGLRSFRGDSRFSTWVYAVARNYLLSVKMKQAEAQEVSFALMRRDLQRNLPQTARADDAYISDTAAADLKIGCTQAMLLCLDREQRLLFILAKVYGIDSAEGARIFGISPQAYRKRISRIAQRIRNFLQENCGLINPSATCNCRKRLPYAIEVKRVDPEKPYFIESIATKEQIDKTLSAMEAFDDEAHIFRTNPEYVFPKSKIQGILAKL